MAGFLLRWLIQDLVTMAVFGGAPPRKPGPKGFQPVFLLGSVANSDEGMVRLVGCWLVVVPPPLWSDLAMGVGDGVVGILGVEVVMNSILFLFLE